ncbi:hypothetical protein [Spirillospora sp. CA-294931]|uniref:hypothetical protein n=1 Tax=Spirillospora sp. CA-294931 TaxID=3240042 RepID=UPI003D91B23B
MSDSTFNISMALGHAVNLNSGFVGGDQQQFGRAKSPEPRSSSGVLPQSLLVEAHKEFVAPEWLGRARKQLHRNGLLLLAGPTGTGRRTAALNLLCTIRGSQSVVHHLDDTVNYSSWRPLPGAADGYLVEGTFGGLLRNDAAVTALATKVREVGAMMVAIIPSDPRLEAELERTHGPVLVRCTPPDARRVFDTRFAAAVPGEDERGRLLNGLSERFVRALLPLGASPKDAEDLVEAVIAVGRADEPVRRAMIIRQMLENRADREIELYLPPLEEPHTLSAVVSAAVFAEYGPHVVVDQAARLLHALPGKDAACPSLEDDQRLTVLWETFGARTLPIREPGRPLALKLVFHRTQWPAAILRQVWRRNGLRVHLVAWLRSVKTAELVRPAGSALALSAPRRGHAPLRQIQVCAASGSRFGQAVAAEALRNLLEDPEFSHDVAGQLARWAYSRDRTLRLTTALALGGGADIAPSTLALPLLRRLIHGAELMVDRSVDEALDTAALDLFIRGDRHLVLKTLHDWADSGGHEGRWAARTFPRLLRRDFAWFEAQVVAEESFFALLVLLIRRISRMRDGNSALRDALLLWRRVAAWSPARAAILETIFEAVGFDAHRRVQQLLESIDRQS